MSDLRERLEQRSERFVLPPDALGRLFERRTRIQRRHRITAIVVALAIGVAGAVWAFSSFRGLSETPATPPSPPQTLSIPNGTYWTAPITREQILSTLQADGFTPRQARRLYFGLLTFPFGRWIEQGLIIQDEFWIQLARSSNGQEESGFGGKFVVLGPHRVRTTDNICTATLRYELSANSLVFTGIRITGPRSSDCKSTVVPGIAIYESAPFVMVSPSAKPSS